MSNRTEESKPTTDYDLFVSYCHQDSPKVSAILAAIRKQGLVLFDPLVNQQEMWGRNLQTWFTEVFPTRAKAAMIFLSKNYSRSQWCNKELEYVLCSARENPSFLQVLPLRLDDAQIPSEASDVVFLDVANTSPDEIALLTKSRIEALQGSSKNNLAILSDEELLRKIADERDNEAFEVLYKRIYPTIWRRILHHFASLDKKKNDETSVEGIASDVLFKLWEQASRFPQDESSFDKWLANLTNRCVSEHELKERRGTTKSIVSSIRESESPLSDRFNTGSPAEVLHAAALLEQVMEGLSDTEKQILELYMSGMSFNEISETLDLSTAAARMMFHRLSTRLRNEMVHREKAYSG